MITHADVMNRGGNIKETLALIGDAVSVRVEDAAGLEGSALIQEDIRLGEFNRALRGLLDSLNRAERKAA